jgi:septum site-determining protein MinC
MSSSPYESTELGPALEIKSGAVNLPIIKLFSGDADLIAAQLAEKISQAPEFFRNAPMAIDLQELADVEAKFDFALLAEAMRDLGLMPVGICGASVRHAQAAHVVGLPMLTQARYESQPQARPPVEAKTKPKPESVPTKFVHEPVRSGQRIYAAGGDLVVLAQVSAGAEIMADGNIHVYGILHGRALAGVQGNLDCRIFCLDLQAQLIAIGGNYRVSENIDDTDRGKPVQIYLKDNALIIEKI